MNGNPEAILSSNGIVRLRDGDKCTLIDVYAKYYTHLNGIVLPDLVRDWGIEDKCHLKAVVLAFAYPESVNGNMVLIQVTTSAGQVVLEEPWAKFPSDHLKSKLLMVCG